MPPPPRPVQPASGSAPGKSRAASFKQLAARRVIRTAEGHPLEVPADWELLPSGDAMLTRRVKAAGECWVMQTQKGRRTISLGLWAPAECIARLRAEVAAARSDPAYQKKLDAGRTQRAADQTAYASDFESAIRDFLAFAPRHSDLAADLAKRVADHAVPVGSGTVARTKRIPLEERARAAVLAWMRHHTTDYDRTPIPRIKNRRREVRRKLAQQSLAVLKPYREDQPRPARCPLQNALAKQPRPT